MRMRCCARLETEAVAEFEKKFLEVVQKLVLEVGLAHDLSRLEPEELEDVGVTNGEAPAPRVRPGPGSMTRASALFLERAVRS